MLDTTAGAPRERRILFDSGDGYRLVESCYGPSQDLSPHSHEISNISLVLSGSLHEESDRGPVRVGAGCTVLRPARNVHADVFGSAGAVLFSIECDVSRRLQAMGATARIPYLWCSTDEMSRRMLRLYARARVGNDSHADLVKREVIDVLARGAKTSPRDAFSPAPSWMDWAQDRMHSADGAPLRVEALAREIGVHRVYLARVFRRCFGSSLTRYLIRLRTTQAARRVAATAEPLAQIALNAGFADQAHFCRAFLAQVGLSPGAYRRSARAG